MPYAKNQAKSALPIQPRPLQDLIAQALLAREALVRQLFNYAIEGIGIKDENAQEVRLRLCILLNAGPSKLLFDFNSISSFIPRLYVMRSNLLQMPNSDLNQCITYNNRISITILNKGRVLIYKIPHFLLSLANCGYAQFYIYCFLPRLLNSTHYLFKKLNLSTIERRSRVIISQANINAFNDLLFILAYRNSSIEDSCLAILSNRLGYLPQSSAKIRANA